MLLIPLNGHYEQNGEENMVIPVGDGISNSANHFEQKIRDHALKQEENSPRHESNKQRKAERNKQTFGAKHGSVRKAKKLERKCNKNKQNKRNAEEIRKYTGR